MAGSSPILGGAFPGLTLRAWVLFLGSTGAILKSGGVSGVARGSAGAYTVTLAAAMADTAVCVDVMMRQSGATAATNAALVYSVTAASFGVSTLHGITAADFAAVYVAIYG